jgi:hypothetical protein
MQYESLKRPIGIKTSAWLKLGATAGQSAVLLPKPRPKQKISRTTVNANRSRATAEVKSCRPGAFDSLLKALNLSPGCES